MKKLFFFIILFVFITSCEKKLDYTLPEGSEHLVVNSILNANADTVVVNISISKPTAQLLDTNLFVNDAVVRLFKDDNFLMQIPSVGSKGYYKAIYQVGEGHNYSLEVDYSDKHAQATVTIPSAPQFTSEILDTANQMIRGTLTFNDPKDERNYYMVSVRWNKPVIVDTIFLPDTILFTFKFVRKDILTFANFGFGPIRVRMSAIASGFAFSDQSINGQTFTFTWYAAAVPTDTIFVQLYQLDKNLYDFWDTYSRMEMINNNPFAQPMNVYTNVDGGLGLVGALSYKEDTLLISDFIHP